MEVLINIVLDVLHITKFLIIGDLFLILTWKIGKLRKRIVYAVTILLSVFLSLSPLNPVVEGILYLLFVFLVYVIGYEERKGKLLVISLWTSFLVSIVDDISDVVAVSSLAVLSIHSRYLRLLLIQLFTLLFLGITGVLLRKKHMTGIRNIGIGYYIGFTILSLADLAVLIYLGDFAMDKVVVDQKIFFQLIFLVVAFGILFQMAMVIFLIVSRNVYQEKEQLSSKYLNEQQKHYEYLELRERKTKKFRHDLRHHMYMLQTLNQEKEYDKLQEYLEMMNGEIEAFGKAICVNNGIVDAILNKFASEAETKGITLQVTGHFPSKCHVSAFDLCIIFSNLLSNALEAEQESGGDTILVTCKHTVEDIVISVENDSVGKRIEKDGRMETSKKDKYNHGFGLENVRECVKRNEGELLIENGQNTFKVFVVLHNEEELERKVEHKVNEDCSCG